MAFEEQPMTSPRSANYGKRSIIPSVEPGVEQYSHGGARGAGQGRSGAGTLCTGQVRLPHREENVQMQSVYI